MSSATRMSGAAVAATLALSVLGCSEEPSGATPATTAKTATSTAAAASTPAPSAPAPTASAAAPGPPRSDCPAGSTGEGTLKAPCEAKGAARMMEVTWTGKMDEKGPSFRIVNKSTLPILYGRIAVYFYDKAGKQMEVQDDTSAPPKPKPNHICFGNLFSGVMKPGEKAVITFSCVQKKNVPEGAAAIEGEMQVVGFADATEKKSEFYWKNADITPDARPKGGVKK